jgi:SAM-dependent methyltransferase
MTLLDFEGDYGRDYNARIRSLIPGYDAIQEIAAAALRGLKPDARSVLVVGPGSGMELPGLFDAMPKARFTLVEPSEQMRGFCSALIEQLGGAERVQWGPPSLETADAMVEGSALDQSFDAVVSHNVLHVLAPAQQQELLQQMAARLAPGGCLLLSSYSESPGCNLKLWMAIARARFAALGLDAQTVNEVMASRNTKVFSMDPVRLEQTLLEAGLEAPVVLVQALFNRLWLIQRGAER